MLRAAIARNVFSQISAFYPYVVKEELRPDQVAEFYYGDPHYAYLVWLSNDIIDPFFQWPLTDAQLNRVVAQRYGDLETARGTIIHYKHPERSYLMTPVTYAHTDPTLLTDWTPVYAYDYEVELNDRRRTIQLVSVDYLPQINSEMRNVLGPNSQRAA